jgi:hypothetical protein
LQTSKDNASLPLFIVFFVSWVLLGIAAAIFDHRASYRTKKFWHPYITIGTGAIFLGFVELMFHGQLPILIYLLDRPHYVSEPAQRAFLPEVQQDGQWPKLVTSEILLKVRRQSGRRKSGHEPADWLTVRSARRCFAP